MWHERQGVNSHFLKYPPQEVEEDEEEEEEEGDRWGVNVIPSGAIGKLTDGFVSCSFCSKAIISSENKRYVMYTCMYSTIVIRQIFRQRSFTINLNILKM